MEVLVEIVAELVVGIGLVVVAYAVGSIVYLQYRVARRSLRTWPAPNRSSTPRAATGPCG